MAESCEFWQRYPVPADVGIVRGFGRNVRAGAPGATAQASGLRLAEVRRHGSCKKMVAALVPVEFGGGRGTMRRGGESPAPVYLRRRMRR